MSTNAGPMTPGTALMLLWRPLSRLISRAVDVDDPRNHRLRGSTGLPIGGMGAVIDAMESAARAAGVTIVTDTPVSSIDVTDDGKVAGVTFSEGSHVEAPVVSSNIDPWQTMLELVPDGAIPDALVRELQSSRPRGNAFKLALALDGVPSMHVGGNIDEGALLGCQFRIAPSLSYLERAWDDAKHGLPSQGPVFWGLIPSISDPALAPPGRHIMSVNIHLAPTQLAGGRTWQQERSVYAQRCIHALAAYYPGLQDRITDMVAWSPLDIEQQLGFVEGSITHGDMLPSNTFSMRPSPSLSRYRTPVKGLYLCGSGSFPGGYVTGLPGHNAAKEILRDRPWPW